MLFIDFVVHVFIRRRNSNGILILSYAFKFFKYILFLSPGVYLQIAHFQIRDNLRLKGYDCSIADM